MKVFVIDIAKCNGCYNCQLVCKDEHCDNEWLPYAKQQPEIGQFWMKMNETVHGSVPKVKIEYVPTPCMHCDDAACLKAAKNGAVYRRDDGLVIIDPVKAKGAKAIVDACPYGAVYWNEEQQIPQKCTGCAHLLDEGRLPRCVESCATGALQFGEEEDFKDPIAEAEVMLPELGAKPRVYYLNLPKYFVAGAVYDPAEDECIQDANATLTSADGRSWETRTDVFGDFWFRRLEEGEYSLKIVCPGYVTQELNGIIVNKSVNVGDIALRK